MKPLDYLSRELNKLNFKVKGGEKKSNKVFVIGRNCQWIFSSNFAFFFFFNILSQFERRKFDLYQFMC